MNKPIALLSSKAFTATSSWLSSFSSPTFIYTSLSSHSVHCTSLTLLVVLLKFNLLPNSSRRNILYRLLEASWELTILYFLLPTPAAFLLLFPYVFPNNFWSYSPTSHIYNMFYLLLLLSISIAFRSLLGSIWVPSLLNMFPSLPPPLYPPPVLGPPTLYVICPPHPPYNYSSLGYAFPSGHTVFLPINLSSALLCLWFLSNCTVLSCHSPMVVGRLSDLASFLLMALFSPLLNSLMRGHPL